MSNSTVDVLIYGASDDLVEVEGAIDGADEFNVYDEWVGTLTSPSGKALRVRAEFCPSGVDDVEWRISVEHTGTTPKWPIHFTTRPDRDSDPAVIITVPVGTILTVKES